MSQTLAIVLRFREEQAADFEQMFRAEILPLWEEFLAQGKFIGASLTPIEGGIPTPEGQRHYILHVEVPGMREHEEFDEHPRFLDFLPRAKALQPEEPLVWFGTTMFKVGG
ncbi:MAG TPA: hypothetical protein VEQ37_03125 [Actinomycetota bacterium]|nr:hypothetical protein [Actinomycetota bacterium]